MFEQIRSALVSFVDAPYKAQYTSIPIVYDNQEFDWNNPPAQFVTFEIDFQSSNQVGMSADPRTRIKGFVYVCVYVRSGTGSKNALTMIDWFANLLKYARIGNVLLHEPEPEPSRAPKGWFTSHLKLYFVSDPA